MSNEREEYVLTKTQILALIDPKHERPELVNEDSNTLMKILFNICTKRYIYKFEDYTVSKSEIQRSAGKRIAELERRERMLKLREHELNLKEQEISSGYFQKKSSLPIADEVRAPDRIIKERLIEPFVPHSLDDVLYQSGREYDLQEAERRFLEESAKNSFKTQRLNISEEEELELALKASLNDFNEKIISKLESVKTEIVERKDCPNYEKLLNLHKDFTKEIADGMFGRLKELDFDGFKIYLGTIPLSIQSLLGRLSFEGSTLKQMIFRKDPNTYKCLL